MSTRGRLLATVYVAVVAALAASAFSTPDSGFTWDREGLAMLLTLPTLVMALPIVYVLGATAWNISGADAGGPMWPVTLTYTLLFAGVAVVNVFLLTRLARLVRRSRAQPALISEP